MVCLQFHEPITAYKVIKLLIPELVSIVTNSFSTCKPCSLFLSVKKPQAASCRCLPLNLYEGNNSSHLTAQDVNFYGYNSQYQSNCYKCHH